MLSYIKRLAKYLLHGQPQIVVRPQITFSDSTKRLLGKRILITGGGKGLGLAIAHKCADEGATVVISGRDEDALKKACDSHKGMSYVVFDVCNISGIPDFLDNCEQCAGGVLDTLVNNAGISLHEGWYDAVTTDSWDKQFTTNLKAPYFLTQAFVRRAQTRLPKETTKKIVFMSSSRGFFVDDIPYGLIKAAVNSLTGGLSRRLLGQNFFVNAIAPGVTASSMTGYQKDGNLYREEASSKRVYLPEEVAETACFLISDVSNCISGLVVPTQNGNHLSTYCK